MKRILTFVVFTCLFASVSITAFAKDTGLGNDHLSTNISVSATVKPVYTVTIPALIELDGSAEIKAENVLTEADKAVMVAITGTNQTDDAFAVSTNDGASIGYEVQKEDKSAVALNAPMVFEEDGREILTFAKIAANQIFAGEYKGVITFTVSYDTITN